MFYYIKGKLVLLEPTFAVIDAGGVAYKMSISQTSYDSLPKSSAGGDYPCAVLYTYLSVKEDGVDLFGFYSAEELSAFKMLISVSGVGPKVALSVLSLLSPEKFAVAVCTEDCKTISKASGVGAKTAARIVLELKDKIAKTSISSEISAAKVSSASSVKPGALSEAIDALTVLGYTRPEAVNALKDIDSSLPAEELIRQALKRLMK